MRHITCTGIYLCASKDYWLSSGGFAVNSEILVSDHAALETAYFVSGLIPGDEMSTAEHRIFEAAFKEARLRLPAGQVRWTENGKFTNGARHVLEQTFKAVQHLLNG